MYVPSVNKWDLVQNDARGPAAITELAELIGCPEDQILKISAKTGWGVEDVLEDIVNRIPSPKEVVVRFHPFLLLKGELINPFIEIDWGKT